jgi:hypothetical protein
MLRPIASKVLDPPLLVSELIDHTSVTLKAELVRNYFFDFDSDVILLIPPSMRKHEDCWTWRHERNGLFIVHFAYRMFIETKKNKENCFESHDNCSYLQKKNRMNGNISGVRRYHQKSKFFCWRLAYNLLPSSSISKNKNLPATTNCKICGVEDTWINLLLQCNISQCVQALIDEEFPDFLDSFHFSDPKH